jgi:hypothetical protein
MCYEDKKLSEKIILKLSNMAFYGKAFWLFQGSYGKVFDFS